MNLQEVRLAIYGLLIILALVDFVGFYLCAMLWAKLKEYGFEAGKGGKRHV